MVWELLTSTLLHSASAECKIQQTLACIWVASRAAPWNESVDVTASTLYSIQNCLIVIDSSARLLKCYQMALWVNDWPDWMTPNFNLRIGLHSWTLITKTSDLNEHNFSGLGFVIWRVKTRLQYDLCVWWDIKPCSTSA